MPLNPGERTLWKKAVFLVEDHPLTRRGLAALIAGEHDLVVCGEAATRGDALRAVAQHPPDLVTSISCSRAARTALI